LSLFVVWFDESDAGFLFVVFEGHVELGFRGFPEFFDGKFKEKFEFLESSVTPWKV
jgi:hypothetical protein